MSEIETRKRLVDGIIRFIQWKKHQIRTDDAAIIVYKNAFSCKDGTIYYLSGNAKEDTGIKCLEIEFSMLTDTDWFKIPRQLNV
jgi:hypothetical protein